MKIRVLLPLFTTLLITVSSVKAQYFAIRELKAKSWDGTEYTFPELTNPSKAAKKINIFLKGNELDILHGKYKKTPFEHIMPAKNSHTGITELEPVILKNTAAVFSVRVSSEYSSASLNEHTAVYNFNSQTGDPLLFSDLLTPSGYQIIKKQVIAERVKKLSSYLKTLNTKDQEAAIAFKVYKECLESIPSDDLDADALTFEKNGIQLERRSCFNDHYGQSLSDHADIYISKLSLTALTPHLSASGKLLLAGKSTAGTTASQTRIKLGVYQGKINGQYPVTLLLNKVKGDELHAIYFYDQVGQQINLYGSIKNKNEIKLSTSSSNQPDSETFDLKVSTDGSLTGTWSKGTRTFKVQLNN